MTKRTVDRVLAGIPDRRRVRTRDVQSLADARREFDAAERDRDEMQAKVRAAIRSGASLDEVRNRYGAEQTKIEARFKAAAKALADSRDVHGWGKDHTSRRDSTHRATNDIVKSVTKAQLRKKIADGDWEIEREERWAINTGYAFQVINHETGNRFWARVSDEALRRDSAHRALDAILARIPRHRARGRDAMTAGEKEHYVALKRRVEYLQRVSVGSSGEDRRKIEAEIRSLGEEMDRMRERTGDEERGIKIPMPKDPKERAAYEAAIAARRARGSGKFVGEDAVDRALALIPDHRRPARRAADRLRRGLGLDSILSKSDARAILREYHAGSKKRLQDLARELKLDERAALAWVLKEAESGKDARDASYLVTAKFADNSTFRQIYQDASEAEAKYADLAADPKVVDCDIQDYEGTPEFEVGDALTEAEMYKAGARMARTGSGKIQVVEKWIEENNLTPNLAAAVMRGFRAEQQSNSHSGRLGGGRTGDALDRVLAAIPNRKRRV